ncbi:MAG: cbb3-type cytochrome c oxidase subunit 3 [Gammaproteobacteria bacterium]|jgi:cytochrome c oxidase cbb3-type subunit 4|nr:cbb3-type cytochrome c oxidase subunit 3 [Gammaproteobacteria bacterium]
MDAGLLRGLYTLFMFIAFIGIVWWAWSSRRKADFDAAASLPLEDDDGHPPATKQP